VRKKRKRGAKPYAIALTPWGDCMNAAAEAPTSTVIFNGLRTELVDRGRGRPILFLHPHIGLDPTAPVLAMLAEGGRVIAPSHPGFGNSERPAGATTVDDLAYFYLDLMDALDLRDCLVVGVSLGAWIAAAIAVKSTARMARLVLGNPIGIKVGDRETRDILDIFAMLEDEFIEKAFADPLAGKRDYRAMSDEEVTVVARNREAAALYMWSPYMHDPKLKSRLHRIRIPTLVLWGTADRLVSEDYGRAFAAAVPGAKFEAIADAGHFPHMEQPKAFAARALAFAKADS
jgi:pimeloyl-ACP methyl ester carboxylesterase